MRDRLFKLLWEYWELTQECECSDLMTDKENIKYRKLCDELNRYGFVKNWEDK